MREELSKKGLWGEEQAQMKTQGGAPVWRWKQAQKPRRRGGDSEEVRAPGARPSTHRQARPENRIRRRVGHGEG